MILMAKRQVDKNPKKNQRDITTSAAAANAAGYKMPSQLTKEAQDRSSKQRAKDRQRSHGCWWTAETLQATAAELFATCNYIRNSEGVRTRRREDRHHLQMFGNFDDAGRGYRASGLEFFTGADGRMRYNLSAAAIGTAASLIAQMRPMPYFLTTMGDPTLQRKARTKTRVIEGQMWDLDVYRIAPTCFQDAAILGTGIMYGYVSPFTGKPTLERVLPLECLVDHNDGRSGCPRSIYRVRLMQRELVKGWMGDDAAALDLVNHSAGPSADDWNDFFLSYDNSADLVVVIEAWHLPSSPTARDGRHVIATSSAVLFNEEWTKQEFPLKFLRWETRPVGFWGCGICEKARKPQYRINEIIERYTEMQRLMSNVMILGGGSAETPTAEQISDLPATYVNVGPGERPPQFVNFSATPMDLVGEVERIKQQFLEEIGLAPGTIQGMPPSRNLSGVAADTYDDIQSRRHIIQARSWEYFFMDITQMICDLNDDVAAADPSFAVSGVSHSFGMQFINEVKWKDLVFGPGKSRVRMFPVSSLPTTPAGKINQVNDWIERGMIGRSLGQQLMDFPDLDAAQSMNLAHQNYIMDCIEKILDGARDVIPDPRADQEIAADFGSRCYLRALVMRETDSVLQELRKFTDAALGVTDTVNEFVNNTTNQFAALPPTQMGALPHMGGPTSPGLPADGGQVIPGMGDPGAALA